MNNGWLSWIFRENWCVLKELCYVLSTIITGNVGLWHQKQFSEESICNCISQNTVECNYLFMPEIYMLLVSKSLYSPQFCSVWVLAYLIMIIDQSLNGQVEAWGTLLNHGTPIYIMCLVGNYIVLHFLWLTHWGRVMHICIIELSHHWFR